MKAHILRGSKREIAERVVRISGEIREAIVFIEDSSEANPSGFFEEVQQGSVEDIFMEMDPYTVRAGGADYSREALYSRLDDE